MLRSRGGGDPLESVRPVVDLPTLAAMIHTVRTVHMAPDVEAYIVELVRATRNHPDLLLGASPRATLHLAGAARARAALEGRNFVIPDDVAALAAVVLAHRLVPIAHGLGSSADDAVRDIVLRIVADTAVPFTPAPIPS